MKAFAPVGMNGEGALPRFAARPGSFKLRADFVARRGGRPLVGRGSV
jgi:hypothetical protein